MGFRRRTLSRKDVDPSSFRRWESDGGYTRRRHELSFALVCVLASLALIALALFFNNFPTILRRAIGRNTHDVQAHTLYADAWTLDDYTSINQLHEVPARETCQAGVQSAPLEHFQLAGVYLDGQTYREVPTVGVLGQQFARLRDDLIVTLSTGSATGERVWVKTSCLSSARFQSLVRGHYDEAENLQVALNASVGYFRDYTRDNEPRKVAFIKTHKTGSTTLRAVLFRMSSRYGLRLFPGDHVMSLDPPTPDQVKAYDVVCQHHSHQGYWENGNYHMLVNWYNSVVDNPKIITIVRNPVTRYLSHFYFFTEPDLRDDTNPAAHVRILKQFVSEGRNRDHLAIEFGLTDRNQIQSFVDNDMPSMFLVFVMERMTESLVVARHLLNLDLKDLAYRKNLDRSQGELVRWDRKTVFNPSRDELGEELLDQIKEITAGDAMIVAKANELLDEKVAALRARGVDVDGEVAAIDDLNRRLSHACPTDIPSLWATCNYYRDSGMVKSVDTPVSV